MNFAHFFNQALGPLGFDLVPNRYHSYCGEYNPDSGWTLSLDTVEFTPRTLVVVHFPDFVTIKDNVILELNKVEEFYKQNLNQVVVTHWTSDLDKHYTGPIHLIKFSNHNYDICNMLAKEFDQWKEILTQPRTHAWQSLNGRICNHRQRTVDILKTHNNGWLSLGTVIPLPDYNYQTYFGCDNIPNFMRLKYVYGSSAVNIITETEYVAPTGIITEKTLFAIAAQQIPIVIGHKGIVDQCRRMGFDMFDDVVNTDYDQLDDSVRVEQAINTNLDLIQGRVDLSKYKKRLERNREFVLWELPRKMEVHFLAQARALADQLLNI